MICIGKFIRSPTFNVPLTYCITESKSGDLNFRAGEIIILLKTIDANWYSIILLIKCYGESAEGYQGIFPSSYVFEENLPQVQPGQKLLIALQTFHAQAAGDLSVNAGDIILGIEKVDENWWRGVSREKCGLLPANFVRELDMHLDNSQFRENDNVPTKRAVVLKSMKAALPEEIDLNEGEQVVIEEFLDKYWCRGTCQNRRGIFPRSFVKIVEEEEEQSRTSLNEYKFAISDSKKDLPAKPTMPYAIVKYQFVPQYEGEMAVEAGELLSLIGHVDNEWTLVSAEGRAGIVPTSYLNIIIDCPTVSGTELQSAIAEANANRPAVTGANSHAHWASSSGGLADFNKSTYYKVLFDYNAATVNHLMVKAGDLITVLKTVGTEWVEAVNQRTLSRGLLPRSYLTAINDFQIQNKQDHMKMSQKRQLDIELEKCIARNLLSLDFDCKNRKISDCNVDSKLISPSSSICSTSPSPSTSKCATALPSSLVMSSYMKCDDSFLSPSTKKIPPPRPKTLPVVHQESPHSGEWNGRLANIFNEILSSEKDYCNELMIIEKAFEKHQTELHMDDFMEKMNMLINLSKSLIGKLENLSTKPTVLGISGIFIDISRSLESAYTSYFETQTTVVSKINEKVVLEKVMVDIRKSALCCFDVFSAILCPIHRVMKYPRYLTEMLKIKDEEYDRLEKQFFFQVKKIRDFMQNLQDVCDRTLSTFNIYQSMAQSFLPNSSDSNNSPSQQFALKYLNTFNQVDPRSAAQKHINALQTDVIAPMAKLLIEAKGLEKLVEKRRDKLLDYEMADSKLQKSYTKATEHVKMHTNMQRMKKCQSEYEALNRQLLVDLPKFIEKCLQTFNVTFNLFIKHQSTFACQFGQQLQQMNSESSQPSTDTHHKPISMGNINVPLVETEGNCQQPIATPNLLLDKPYYKQQQQQQSQNLQNSVNSIYTELQAIFTDTSKRNEWVQFSDNNNDKSIFAENRESVDELSANKPSGAEKSGSTTTDWREDEQIRTTMLLPSRFAPPPPASPPHPEGYSKHRLNSTASSNIENEEEDTVDFCIALFDFSASGPDELSVAQDDLLAVHQRKDLQDNEEWWLVENEFGNVGYVPANYLKLYAAL
ncbi:putative SH3 domain protein [Trichinella spiralis]|uniref:SH3 domain-containing protein 19 n=1 Tax=Trichinella spiralis TaxID=6334 RepID=E5S0Z3_TRISP|nr:putative SH3 domain protein [Trichinella spiralis]KRY43440.1 SH3 domain-containing protein 19 [Trichinella spiralis]